MDRFYWSVSTLASGEREVCAVSGIRLYDGEKKTSYDDGHLTLTNHRLLWYHSNFPKSLALDASSIIFYDDVPGGFASRAKVVLHLSMPERKSPGPSTSSAYTYVKLCFKHGSASSFIQNLQTVIKDKAWENVLTSAPVQSPNKKQIRAGILGIERDIQKKQNATSKHINVAFEDLRNLMGLAKEMVAMSKNIANKIKEQTGEISSDETVQLRSYLLSLGIDDPVTKEAVGSTTKYHQKLAEEISSALETQVKEVGGVMLLSEVYCRINRARGLQLLSPEDVSNACSLMQSFQLPLIQFTFESGVQVLQLASLDEKIVSDSLKQLLDDHRITGFSASEFSQVSGVPLLLAQERLVHAEKCAAAVRDESTEGLRFYPNLFVNDDS